MAQDDTLRSAQLAWEARVQKSLSKVPERKSEFVTSSGQKVERLYTPLREGARPYEEALGFPGSFPFTRGVQPTQYRGRLWTMRQYAGFGSAAESNQRYRYLLSQGQTGLSVAFDLPTQMGYDSDHAMSQGEVGKVGVAIDTLEDMGVLMDQIPLDQVSTSMTINATAGILLSLYAAVAEGQGVATHQLRGTIQNDILKEYMARGTYIFPPRPSMRLITDIFSWCRTHAPSWNTISISGYHIREAGCTAVQEVAFTLADGIAYVEAAIKAGLEVDNFAPQLSFFFNVHNNFMEEVAKFRAARRLWAHVMKERFGARDPRSWMLRFHAQTAGSTLTAQQPQVNTIRVTLQALAAVMGGAQSLHTNSLDEALALPTPASAKLALRTQQVIGYESGIPDFIDPMGGSFALEALTDSIEAAARVYLAKIDSLGGMTSAIEQGFPQHEIQDAAYAYQLSVESGETPIVGLNLFQEEEEGSPELLELDPALEEQQIERLRVVKAGRNQGVVKDCLDKITQAAAGDTNLMPLFLEAVKHHVSLGEISQALRSVFGVYRENIVL